MVMEQEPLAVDDLPAKFQSWVQDVGGFAAVGLAIWLIARFLQRSSVPTSREPRPFWFRILFSIGCVGAGVFYLILGLAVQTSQADLLNSPLQRFLATAGGGCAIVAAGLPFVVDLVRLSWRRIWALAVLSFREAMNRKVFLIFFVLVFICMFLDWFVPNKPESQLRSYVQILYFVTAALLLVTAAVLASFSIPADVRHQTIHTLVTKPVERFEIVLGRFLGYTLLFSLTLAAMVLGGLIYVRLVGIHPDALEKNYRARVPVYGELQLYGAKGQFQDKEGLVGREWEYRRYIAGGENSPQRAIWLFRQLPTRLNDRRVVPCEYSFDVFRTRRGPENKGVFCTFVFRTRNQGDYDEFQREQENLRRRSPSADEVEIDNQLARKYGFFEVRSREIFDFDSFRINVPVGLFENAAAGPPASERSGRAEEAKAPLFAVVLKCESPSQFVGVAKRDLYLVDAEGSFGLNFFKGAAGLWCRLCLVIGLAVACSTYLSGVVSLLCTGFLCVLGLFTGFVISVAAGTNEGGGPAESFYRIVNRQNPTMPLDQTPSARVAAWSDQGFRWFLRRFLNVVPDMDFYDLKNYVAEGFDISSVEIGLRVLMLFGYLLPWAVLAYYLMKSREIAS